jgi:hypothetical protein
MNGEAGEILEEFYERVRESLVILTLTRRGLNHVITEFAGWVPQPGNPDPTISIGPEPASPGVMTSATIHRSKLFELLDEGGGEGHGQAFVAQSQQWIVLTYAMWDENFRPRIAAAAGVEKNDIAIDALGDLRHMRHDIAHHLGIASADHSARCVELKWFDIGDQIHIAPHQIREFVEALPGYELTPWEPVREGSGPAPDPPTE